MQKVGPYNFPRRNQLPWLTPAEMAIRQAVLAVEEAGCHPLLTDAVNLLSEAQSKVADFVELPVPSVLPESGEPKQPTVRFGKHRIGLSNGGVCVYCGESTERIREHPDMKCRPPGPFDPPRPKQWNEVA